MTGVVVFNATAFKVLYPEFAAVSDPVLQGCFDTATLYLNNTATSRVSDLTRRTILLNLLTAHIARLQGLGTSGASGLVGRVSSATEGTVSVQTSYVDHVVGSMAWFIQTPYGASYWAATAAYRTMVYRAAPSRCR